MNWVVELPISALLEPACKVRPVCLTPSLIQLTSDWQLKSVMVRVLISHISVNTTESESESEVAQSCPTLCDPMDCVAHQAPLSMGFSRQEYWSGLPFPSPGNLPRTGHFFTREKHSPAQYMTSTYWLYIHLFKYTT